jgi:hypothetical protein
MSRKEGHLSDEQQQNFARRNQRLAEKQFNQDLQDVMSSDQGRRLFAHLIFNICGVESLSYGGEATDTVFREGRRDVGITLITLSQDAAPGHYLQMISEMVAERSKFFRNRNAMRTKSDEPDGSDNQEKTE